MDILESIRMRRSIRCYENAKPVSQAQIEALMELMRYYPCPGNIQPLKFIVVATETYCDQVFQSIKWARYLPDYRLSVDQRPNAYIIVLGNRAISNQYEFCAGAAITQLMIGAQAMGLASCCLGISDKSSLYEALAVDIEKTELLYAIALGHPNQISRVIPMKDDCRYRLDDQGIILVPKHSIEEIVQII